jgi:N-acetylmuramoyl-L-alanine amidase CwlA
MANIDRLYINRSYPTDPSNFTVDPGRKVEWIVIHYTGGTAPALNNVRYYQLPGCDASAHYFVGNKTENGQIYQGVDPKDRAWHIAAITEWFNGARNYNSIGIETACHNDTAYQGADSPDWYFDPETVDSLVELVKALMADYGIDADHVVRHYDCTHKLCPAMWVHDEAAWLAFKARLTEAPARDDLTAVAVSVSAKLGLTAPDYWADRLHTDTALAALFKKFSEALRLPGDGLYRVQAGAFAIKANADAMRDKLVRLGFADAFVTDRKPEVST